MYRTLHIAANDRHLYHQNIENIASTDETDKISEEINNLLFYQFYLTDDSNDEAEIRKQDIFFQIDLAHENACFP